MSDTDTDVVVIGAGIAGLTTAWRLSQAGMHPLVLEARDRVGGRLFSKAVAGGGLDLGATWFWPHEARVGRLVAELGVATDSQHIAGDAMLELPAGVQRIDGNPIDVVSGRFVDGAQSLAQAVADRLPPEVVRLEHAVTAIEDDGSSLRVVTPRGTLGADHVVVALPPALAVSAISISPALPSRLARLAQSTPVWMGAITKVVVEYPEPFWRATGLAGAAMSHVGPMRELHDMCGPKGQPAAVFGFAPATRVGAPTVTSDQVIAQMTALFGPAAASPRRVWIQDWRDEAFTSPPGVERLTDYQTFGHADYASPALGGRLHWSSTETATDAPGHIEGALAAAERTVAAITRRGARARVPPSC